MPTIPPAFVPEVPPDEVVPTLKVGGAWPQAVRSGRPRGAQYAVGHRDPLLGARSAARPAARPQQIPRQRAELFRQGHLFPLPNDPAHGPGRRQFRPGLDPGRRVVAARQLHRAYPSARKARLTPPIRRTRCSIIFARCGDLARPDAAEQPAPAEGRGAGAVAVDDLWHATMMSRGSFVSAKSPIEVSYGLAQHPGRHPESAEVARCRSILGPGAESSNNVIFEPTIEPGWAGDLLKVQIESNDRRRGHHMVEGVVGARGTDPPAFVGTSPGWTTPSAGS